MAMLLGIVPDRERRTVEANKHELTRREKQREKQGHREFPFGNSRELSDPKIPAGIPGNFRNCHLQFFFVQELSNQHSAALL